MRWSVHHANCNMWEAPHGHYGQELVSIIMELPTVMIRAYLMSLNTSNIFMQVMLISSDFVVWKKSKDPSEGGDTYRKLLEREVWWILNLQSRFPTDLNHRYNMDIFLK